MSELSDPIGGLTAGAISIHELFIAYVDAGFTREEALEIIIRMMTAGLKPPEQS
jgi:hypothetical protein